RLKSSVMLQLSSTTAGSSGVTVETDGANEASLSTTLSIRPGVVTVGPRTVSAALTSPGGSGHTRGASGVKKVSTSLNTNGCRKPPTPGGKKVSASVTRPAEIGPWMVATRIASSLPMAFGDR